MRTRWDDTSWQEEFLEMKSHKPLMEGARGFRDPWQLGMLHKEYKRLKKRFQQRQQEQDQQ